MKIHRYLLLAVLVSFPIVAMGFAFDKNNLMSDAELESCNLTSASHVQEFLEERGSYLATYSSEGEKASSIIAGAARDYNVSTCWLLATLQKEQSLITIDDPSQGRLDWAMGFACPSSGGCDQRYKGFKKQVESAAWQVEEGYRKKTYSFKVGKTTTTEDGVEVTPRNFATAVNYNYTPVAGPPGGNYLLVKAWSDFRTSFATSHPAGTLLKAKGSAAIYLTVYEDDQVKKGLITNVPAFEANGYSFKRVIETTRTEIDSYPNTNIRISYPDAMLIKGSGPAIYIMENGRRRHIASGAVAKVAGLNLSRVKKISDAELATIPGGPSFSDANKKVSGTLVQVKGNPAIYVIDDGRKRHIADETVLKANKYSFRDVKYIAQAEMDSYGAGPRMTLDDGLIVRGDTDAVYIAQDGKLRLVSSETNFKNLGYSFGWVTRISQRFVDSTAKGDSL